MNEAKFVPEEYKQSPEFKEKEPSFKIEFVFSPHASVEDLRLIRERFDKCDIYIPESIGFAPANLELTKRLSLGEILPERFGPSRDIPSSGLIVPFQRAALEMIYGSHKIIAMADVTADDELMKEFKSLFRERFELSPDFNVFLAKVEDFNSRFAALQLQREEKIIGRLKDVLRDCVKEYPSLLQKDHINVLMSMGSDHARLGNQLRDQGLDVTTLGTSTIRNEKKSLEENARLWLYNSLYPLFIRPERSTLEVMARVEKLVSVLNYDDAEAIYLEFYFDKKTNNMLNSLKRRLAKKRKNLKNFDLE